MAYRFLVCTFPAARAQLCEGGVYCDVPLIRERSEYVGNDFAAGAAEVLRLNTNAETLDAESRYELRDSLIGCDASDAEVLSSLETWQLRAILAAQNGAAEADEKAIAAYAFCTRMAEHAGAIRSGMAAGRLAHSNNSGARHTAAALDRLALACHDSDAAAGYAALSEFVTGATEAESAWLNEWRANNASASALAYYRRERDARADRNANQENTIRALRESAYPGVKESTYLAQSPFLPARQLNEKLAGFLESGNPAFLAAAIGAAVACVTECDAMRAERDLARNDSAEYRQQRDAEGARAHSLGARVLAANGEAAAYRGAWDRLARELGGMTLSQLPADSYGIAIASALLAGKRDIAESI